MADNTGSSDDFTFDDLEIGHIERSRTVTLTEDDIIEFAQRFDPMPIHVDRVAAIASRFGGITASGSHMLALRQRLLHGLLFGKGVIVSIGLDDVRYRAPLRANLPVWVQIEALEKTPSRSKPELGVARVGMTMFAGGDVVLTLVDVVLMRRTVSTA